MATEWTSDRNGKNYVLNENLIVANCTMCGTLCSRYKDVECLYSQIRDTAAFISGKSFCECCATSIERQTQ